jgi:hypothetical protein
MKIHTNQQHRTDELLKEASEGKPLMGLEEVEQIVNAGRYTSAAGFKGIHIGINTVIVTSGIIVSSFLAYMALKVDKRNAQDDKFKIENTISQITENKLPVADAKQVEPITSNVSAMVSKNEKHELNQDNLLASSNNKIIAKKKKEIFNNSGKLSESSRGEKKSQISTTASNSGNSGSAAIAASSSNRKMLKGEVKISFPYNDQEVMMKLVGDDISELYIDDRLVAREKYDDYSEMISEGRNFLAGHGKEAERNSLDLIQYFDSQLLQDKLIAINAAYTFELSSSHLLINKSAQSNESFTKYKKLYETKTGKEITVGSVYKFEKGQK